MRMEKDNMNKDKQPVLYPGDKIIVMKTIHMYGMII